jgi:hypothetical protein
MLPPSRPAHEYLFFENTRSSLVEVIKKRKYMSQQRDLPAISTD